MKLDSSVVAVVTGGASGLGEASARALAALGVRVAIFDLQADAGERVAAQIGGLFCPVDVSSDDSVAAGFARARAAHGQERILVTCAGVTGGTRTAWRDARTGEIRFFQSDAFARIVDINLVGTFRCIAQAAAGMLALDLPSGTERGAIVNTASVAAQDGSISQSAYAASKAGVAGMTLPIARDLGREGIRVNTILPGTFDTPMFGDKTPQVVKDELAANVPFPSRLGDPAEFASLVIEMLGNGYLNGESVRLDGALRVPPW